MWIYSTLVTHGLASGEPLADVHHEAEEGRRRLARSAQRGAARFHDGATRFHPDAAGLDPVFGSFGSEEIDEHHLEHYLQSPELGPRARADAVGY